MAAPVAGAATATERTRLNAPAHANDDSDRLLTDQRSASSSCRVGAALFVMQPLFLLVAVGYVPSWLVGSGASRVLHEYTVTETERDPPSPLPAHGAHRQAQSAGGVRRRRVVACR